MTSILDNLKRKTIEKIVWTGTRWEFYILRGGKYSLSHYSSTICDGFPKEEYSFTYSENYYSYRFRESDVTRVNFLESKIFNLIIFDPLTNQWCIGDKDTNIFAAYDFDLRKCIDRLILLI